MSDFPTPGYLVLKGTGDTRTVFHPDGKTQVGILTRSCGLHWHGVYVDGRKVFFKNSKTPMFTRAVKDWKNSLVWGLSEDDLIKKS